MSASANHLQIDGSIISDKDLDILPAICGYKSMPKYWQGGEQNHYQTTERGTVSTATPVGTPVSAIKEPTTASTNLVHKRSFRLQYPRKCRNINQYQHSEFVQLNVQDFSYPKGLVSPCPSWIGAKNFAFTPFKLILFAAVQAHNEKGFCHGRAIFKAGKHPLTVSVIEDWY